jgi:hypothetical protein
MKHEEAQQLLNPFPVPLSGNFFLSLRCYRPLPAKLPFFLFCCYPAITRGMEPGHGAVQDRAKGLGANPARDVRPNPLQPRMHAADAVGQPRKQQEK